MGVSMMDLELQKTLRVLAVFGALGLAACSSLTPSPQTRAMATEETDERHFAWCTELGLDLGTNCGFDTLEQCRATILAIGGHCFPNPDRGVAVTAQLPRRNN
jgi:hypothetical protein